ncbi:hypothetical protein ACSBR1_024101 [Camellia fascicularis]
MKGGVVIEEGFIYEEETHLTVFKTSLSFSSDGFTVYDCKGDLVFRVDSYRPDTHDRAELVLMDASGRCLLTVRRKRLSLHQRWEGFVGERTDGQKPIFSVKRSSIIGRSSLTVEVNDNPEEYHIEGSFAQRCCTILDGKKQSVAEIKQKVDASTNVVLGKDVISLLVKPGFDGCFAVALVLVIDQINGADFDDGARVEVVDPLPVNSNISSSE